MEPTPIEQDIQTTISRNAAVSIFANLFYLVTRLFIPPFILHYLTLQEYGIWTICFIFVGYIGMGVFGISNVYLRYIAVYASKNQIDMINKLVSTGLYFVGGVCLLSVPILWLGLPYFLKLFNVKPELQAIAFTIVFGTTLAFLVDMVLSAFSYTLQSLQKFTIEKIFWMISILVEAIVIVIALWMGWGLYGLLFAYIARVIVAAILFAAACYRYIPGFSVANHFDWSLVKLFYNYGGIVQTTGILGIINRSTERVFAGFFMGPPAAALYDVGEKFPMMATTLPSSINAVLLPATTDLHAREQHDQIRDVYLHSSRWINMMTGIMMGFMAPFAFILIKVWLGTDPKYYFAGVILAVFTFPYQMDVMTGPASAIYRSINKPFREMVYSLLQLALVLIAAVLIFIPWGATIWTINLVVASMMVVSVFIYVFLNNRFLKVPQGKFFWQVLFPGLVPYVVGFGLYWILHGWVLAHESERWPTFWRLLTCLILYLGITLPLMYRFLCPPEERIQVRKIFNKIALRQQK